MKKMGCVDRLINFYWAHQSQKRNRSEYYWGTLRQTITECWDKTWLMLSCTNDLKYVVHCHCQVQFAEFYWVCYFHSQFFPYSKKYWLLLRTFFQHLESVYWAFSFPLNNCLSWRWMRSKENQEKPFLHWGLIRPAED